MGSLSANALHSSSFWALQRQSPPERLRTREQELRGLFDAAIRAGAVERSVGGTGTEWALIDTHGCDPGSYIIREWTNAAGVSRSLERAPTRRCGGVIGLFTLHPDCACVGPCPPGVDDGAGLLLVGLASMLAVPLPDRAMAVFQANWLVAMSTRVQAFGDAEINRICLLAHALLDAPEFPNGHKACDTGESSGRSADRRRAASCVLKGH